MKHNGFCEQEIESYTEIVRENLLTSMQMILKSMAELEIPFAENERCEEVQNFQVLANNLWNDPENPDLEPLRRILEDFSRDPGVQECLARRHEFHLPDSAEYFMSRVRIKSSVGS